MDDLYVSTKSLEGAQKYCKECEKFLKGRIQPNQMEFKQS